MKIDNIQAIIKLVFNWLFSFLILGSLMLNFCLIGVIYIDREIIQEHSNYMKHRDSIQLELMDRLVNKNK